MFALLVARTLFVPATKSGGEGADVFDVILIVLAAYGLFRLARPMG